MNLTNKGRCIEWPGCTNGKGYGLINLSREKRLIAHRVIYEGVHGKVHGLVIDHLCRNKICINIKHLRAITNAENVLIGVGVTAQNKRKTVCIRGHEFTIRSNGWRECKTCKKEWNIKKQAIRARSAAHKPAEGKK